MKRILNPDPDGGRYVDSWFSTFYFDFVTISIKAQKKSTQQARHGIWLG
ncbi:MAG: hypothetical protein V3R52_02795 [Candidatus Neomarinimicrobiota bacterium]